MGTEYTRELKHKESTANHWAVTEFFIVYFFGSSNSSKITYVHE